MYACTITDWDTNNIASSNTFEEGLLGIAAKGSTVYLHFTEKYPSLIFLNSDKYPQYL
jgi:hypothetical protein